MFERRNGSEWNKTCEHQLVSEKYLGVKISEDIQFCSQVNKSGSLPSGTSSSNFPSNIKKRAQRNLHVNKRYLLFIIVVDFRHFSE